MATNIMLLTNRLDQGPSGGRQLLCKLNHDILYEIYGERLIVFELTRRPIRGLSAVIEAFKGHIDGIDADSITSALKEIQKKRIDTIFIDGSNLGHMVKIVKKMYPDIKLCTFFHNVEAKFFLGSLRQSRSVKALAVLIINFLAERKAVRYSDQIICLSERDNRLLRLLYGRAATDISPMAVRDKLPATHEKTTDDRTEIFALFVGGAFYANRYGVDWFVRNVAPHVDMKTYIVGRGFEALKDELALDGKIAVVGGVESLSDWYLRAHVIIAPIFDGSGMKTKVAEAMMFGKKIIGTSEAFSGYDDVSSVAGRVCISADDFIAAISNVGDIVNNSFDLELRSIYEEKYSFHAAKQRFERILHQA